MKGPGWILVNGSRISEIEAIRRIHRVTDIYIFLWKSNPLSYFEKEEYLTKKNQTQNTPHKNMTGFVSLACLRGERGDKEVKIDFKRSVGPRQACQSHHDLEE